MRALVAIALVLAAAGCDSADAPTPLDASAGALVATEADLLAARDAWLAARPDRYRYSYTARCEECSGGDVVTVEGMAVVAAESGYPEGRQTLDDLFETARGAFRPGYGGEVRLSQTVPRFPVLVRVGRTEPEPFPTSDVGLLLTVTGFETLR